MFDILAIHDFFNREGPSYAFKLDHILFIVISLLLVLLLYSWVAHQLAIQLFLSRASSL